MTTQQIESYLKERPGYLKKGAESLCDILDNQGYIVTKEQCADALSNVRKEFRGVEATQTIKYTLTGDVEDFSDKVTPPVDLSNYQPVKVWGKDGNWSASYELKSDEEEEELRKSVEKVKEELKNYIDSRPKKETPKETGKGRGMIVLTDLHLGALVGNLVKNTPEYSYQKAIDYLEDAAERINKRGFSEVRISILGDIIESFTGRNHPETWKELHSTGYGANVVIMAYEILSNFLSKINNLTEVYVIGGNHDRVTQKNDEDSEYGVAKIISYFLNSNSDYEVFYDHMIMTVAMDGIDYILSHGHLPMVKKNPEYLILNYGKNRDNFTLILTGHIHSRQRVDQTNTAMVLSDSRNYRAYSCPSIFTGNFYSEQLGMSSTPGFMVIESHDGKPEVTDITL